MSEFDFLSKYPGKIKLNGNIISRLRVCQQLESCEGDIDIELIPERFVDIVNEDTQEKVLQYKVFVKSYMLEHSTDTFLFMKTWNSDNPMPMRMMNGTIEKETRSMYLMNLSGVPHKTTTCSRCGRTLVNPVSKVVGVGPECCSKLGIDVALFDRAACEEHIIKIEEKIKQIKWQGWVPKTAILTLEEYTDA